MKYLNLGDKCERVRNNTNGLEGVVAWVLESNETGAEGTRGERNNTKKRGELWIQNRGVGRLLSGIECAAVVFRLWDQADRIKSDRHVRISRQELHIGYLPFSKRIWCGGHIKPLFWRQKGWFVSNLNTDVRVQYYCVRGFCWINEQITYSLCQSLYLLYLIFYYDFATGHVG